jgi:hypothetical protein
MQVKHHQSSFLHTELIQIITYDLTPTVLTLLRHAREIRLLRPAINRIPAWTPFSSCTFFLYSARGEWRMLIGTVNTHTFPLLRHEIVS